MATPTVMTPPTIAGADSVTPSRVVGSRPVTRPPTCLPRPAAQPSTTPMTISCASPWTKPAVRATTTEARSAASGCANRVVPMSTAARGSHDRGLAQYSAIRWPDRPPRPRSVP